VLELLHPQGMILAIMSEMVVGCHLLAREKMAYFQIQDSSAAMDWAHQAHRAAVKLVMAMIPEGEKKRVVWSIQMPLGVAPSQREMTSAVEAVSVPVALFVVKEQEKIAALDLLLGALPLVLNWAVSSRQSQQLGGEWVEWAVLLPVSLAVKSVAVQVLKLEALLLDPARALDRVLDLSEALPLD